MVGDIISDLMTTSWETRAAVGEPASTIRVNDLSFTISGPHDAWGRPSRPQPVSVSVEMAFSELFSASSSGDVVGADTVHYGKLSKEIQKIMGTVDGQSLTGVFNELWMGLGAWDILERKGPGGEPKGSAEGSAAYVQFAIYLPKASLLGSGVSMAGSAATSSHNGVPILRRKAVTLRFHDLRVPTLIGVNDNEREAEQMVVANVEVDRWLEREDGYSLLERVITKVSAALMST